MTVSKEELFKKRLSEKDVEIPGVGTVRVRALSRGEVLSIKNDGSMEMAEMERKLISKAMVDPVLTEDEVGQWQDACGPSELEPIAEAVLGLSGMSKELAKEAVRQFPQ